MDDKQLIRASFAAVVNALADRTDEEFTRGVATYLALTTALERDYQQTVLANLVNVQPMPKSVLTFYDHTRKIAMPNPKYRIELVDKKGSFWFRIVHRNGNIIATSETYKRKGTRTRIAKNLGKEANIEVVDKTKS